MPLTVLGWQKYNFGLKVPVINGSDRRELCPIAGSFSEGQFFAFSGGRLRAPVQFECQIQAIKSISV